jgi:hypothetical protein
MRVQVLLLHFCLVEHGGFEPPTSTLRTLRATNCANAPTSTAKNTIHYFVRDCKRSLCFFRRIRFRLYQAGILPFSGYIAQNFLNDDHVHGLIDIRVKPGFPCDAVLVLKVGYRDQVYVLK